MNSIFERHMEERSWTMEPVTLEFHFTAEGQGGRGQVTSSLRFSEGTVKDFSLLLAETVKYQKYLFLVKDELVYETKRSEYGVF